MRAFWEEMAFPSAVIGPVARRVTASVTRDRDNIDGARLLDLAVLPRQKAQASF